MGYGLLTGGIAMTALLATGTAVAAFGLFGWAFEPSIEPAPAEERRLQP